MLVPQVTGMLGDTLDVTVDVLTYRATNFITGNARDEGMVSEGLEGIDRGREAIQVEVGELPV